MFNGIWLVATEPLTVQGREIATGERFQVSRIHSGALLVMGRATLAPRIPPEPVAPPQPASRRRGRPRKVTPPADAVFQNLDSGVEINLTTDDEPRPKRRYRRRDLQAEEA